MKTHFPVRKLFAVAVSCLLSMGALWADVNPKPFVIPELKIWTGAEGQTALSGRIVVKSSKLNAVANALAADYEQLTGRKLTVVTGSAKAGDIVLSVSKDKKLGNEGYTLQIGNTVALAAATAQGAFWGTRTLLQVSEQRKDGTLPKGSTVDVPEYQLLPRRGGNVPQRGNPG